MLNGNVLKVFGSGSLYRPNISQNNLHTHFVLQARYTLYPCQRAVLITSVSQVLTRAVFTGVQNDTRVHRHLPTKLENIQFNQGCGAKAYLI